MGSLGGHPIQYASLAQKCESQCGPTVVGSVGTSGRNAVCQLRFCGARFALLTRSCVSPRRCVRMSLAMVLLSREPREARNRPFATTAKLKGKACQVGRVADGSLGACPEVNVATRLHRLSAPARVGEHVTLVGEALPHSRKNRSKRLGHFRYCTK